MTQELIEELWWDGLKSSLILLGKYPPCNVATVIRTQVPDCAPSFSTDTVLSSAELSVRRPTAHGFDRRARYLSAVRNQDEAYCAHNTYLLDTGMIRVPM